MKLKYIIAGLSLLSPLTAQADTVVGELAGLTNPTGVATKGGDTRQYAWTSGGGEVTITYTLNINMGGTADLTAAFEYGTLFRRPGTSNTNMQAGDKLTITLDSIVANSGWILNSVTKTNTVGVAGDNRNGSELVTVSVNGGTAFDASGLGTTGVATVTDKRLEAFDAAGDTLFFEVNAGNAGKVNLKNVAFSFDVTAVPEPASAALLGLGKFTLILRPSS